MFTSKSGLLGSTAAFCTYMHTSVCKWAKSLKRKTKHPISTKYPVYEMNQLRGRYCYGVEAPNN